MAHWGNRLEQAMAMQGQTKALALAHALNVSESTISRWRKGETISVKHAVQLCRHLNVSMDWIFLEPIEPGEKLPKRDSQSGSEILKLIERQPEAVGEAIIVLLKQMDA